MIDKELIQALRRCTNESCYGCPAWEEMCQHDDGEMFHREAADRLEALIAENERLREVTKMIPQWVSVKERMPEENTCVVALDRYMIAATGSYDGVWHGMFGHDAVTHWMPLPEPPGTEGGWSE